jgi:hypothetical protein
MNNLGNQEIRVWWLAIQTRGETCSYEELKRRKVVAQGWSAFEDLAHLIPLVTSNEELQFEKEIKALHKKAYSKSIGGRNDNRKGLPKKFWQLFKLKPGDLVVALEGEQVKGICQIDRYGYESYSYDARYEYAQIFANPVKWHDWNESSKIPVPKRVYARTLAISKVKIEASYIIDCWPKIAKKEAFLTKASIVMDDSEEDAIEYSIRKSKTLRSTEKECLILARKGQGLFRKNLGMIERKCRLTGTSDKRFLIASHIKPWRICNNSERLDGNNGFLMAPHVDKLFDNGWISFRDSGGLMTANARVVLQLKNWGIDPSQNIGTLNAKQKKYLRYHRENIFES